MIAILFPPPIDVRFGRRRKKSATKNQKALASRAKNVFILIRNVLHISVYVDYYHMMILEVAPL